MKKPMLRVAWFIPNILMYTAWIAIGVFIYENAAALNEIHRLGIWIVAEILIFFVAVFGTYRIVSWIKQSKL